MPQITKTKGPGAFAKSIAPAKPAAPTPTPAAKAGRIGNLGAWAHPPKRKGK